MFEIGVITKPQGIRGEVRIFPTTDDPSRFGLLVGKEIVIKTKGAEKNFKLLQAREHKTIIIARFEGITDRNMAETFVNATVLIPETLALPLEEGEFFIRDLIGLDVVDEDGTAIGTLTRVLNTNANDVYVITATVEGEEQSFMIPAVKSVIVSTSLADKKMVIRMQESFRELVI